MYLGNYNKYKFDGIFACFLGKYLKIQGPVIVYTKKKKCHYLFNTRIVVVYCYVYTLQYILLSVLKGY